ncbi:MAG TPA: penicillin-binding transpeptidase domain-containing protein [Candidatus Angelobacter sp.]|nr:penicillin-binding transpeptidase domain-containing protein [Candidatus Angelobacter sp.]
MAIAILVLCVGQRAVPACAAATQQFASQDLHTQATAALLARDFNGPDLSYLLLDESGQVIAQRWEHAERDVPVGSLVKPFLAAAYAQTHQGFPAFHCAGKKTCWLPRGHGTLQIREAIAFSCNSYFHQLVAAAGPGFMPALNSYALHGAQELPPESRSMASAAPLALAQAYLELTHHAREAGIAPILQGMVFSAQKGTGKAAGAELPHISVLAKTGTAPCTHKKKAPGDGFAMVMAPADHPRVVVLVRLHGKPGFMAAGVAGQMIAALEGNAAAK